MNKYLFFLLLACFITSMTLSLETLDKENNESPKFREWLIQYYWWQTNDREQAEAFDGKGELPAFLKPVITMHIIRHDNEQSFSIAKAGKHVLGAKVTPAPKSAKLSTKLFLFYSNEEIKARKEKGSGLVLRGDRYSGRTCQTTKRCSVLPACVCADGQGA